MNEHLIAYWNREGSGKMFTHPVNIAWLQKYLPPPADILDYGCGYGRVVATLAEHGYQATGVDAAGAMTEKARRLHPTLRFAPITPPETPFADETFDAAVLFAVLTCIPGDDEQRAAIEELCRVLKPGGLLYVSDYWLQTDQRNLDRYAQWKQKYSTWGVFEVADGVAVRHHSRVWIAELLQPWEPLEAADFQVTTMNGHPAAAFQWLGRKIVP
jgi:SAM-dependent methyltransferase